MIVLNIDLTSLINRTQNKIELDEVVSFSDNYLEESEILKLDNIKVTGDIFLNEENLPFLSLNVSGNMILEDSISLNEISYPFSLKIEEKLENFSENITNTIDIMDILWQNIVLEVPLQLTEVEDLSQYQGEGWRLVSEEEMNKDNNPFSNLKDLLGEE